MHCLPAQRGREITHEVTDGPQGAVFDQKGCTACKAVMGGVGIQPGSADAAR